MCAALHIDLKGDVQIGNFTLLGLMTAHPLEKISFRVSPCFNILLICRGLQTLRGAFDIQRCCMMQKRMNTEAGLLLDMFNIYSAGDVLPVGLGPTIFEQFVIL